MLNRRHATLLENRGLDIELLERLGVKSSERGLNWVEIPYFVRERQVNTKFRTIAGKKEFSQEAGAEKCFWNHDVLLDDTLVDMPLIITEGELDAFSAIQCGFLRTVSVPDGAPAQEIGDNPDSKKYAFLDHAMPLLRDVRTIILATDDDAPGHNLLEDLSLRLGRHRCKWLRYPAGCKDLNDVLQKFDQKGVVETINAATWCRVDGIFRLSELPPRPQLVAYTLRMPIFEEHYKLRLGDMTVLTGVPGHGKSTLLNEVMGHMAVDYFWRSAVASFEQEPQTDHRRALRRWFNRKPALDQSPGELKEADDWIDEQFLFLVPNEDEDRDLPWLLEKAATAVTRYDCRLLVIDPWNEMDHARPRDMSLTEYTGEAIRAIRRFAKKYRTHVIVAAHPTKLERQRDGKIPCPTLYDISDSAHWANKPDIGLIVHRIGHETLLRVQKARYPEETGETGDVTAVFDRNTGRYKDFREGAPQI